jgi:hypothetical protein
MLAPVNYLREHLKPKSSRDELLDIAARLSVSEGVVRKQAENNGLVF